MICEAPVDGGQGTLRFYVVFYYILSASYFLQKAIR